jgi:23S rRNA C2498 (ribose-2'-O)-methylase RlmM
MSNQLHVLLNTSHASNYFCRTLNNRLLMRLRRKQESCGTRNKFAPLLDSFFMAPSCSFIKFDNMNNLHRPL